MKGLIRVKHVLSNILENACIYLSKCFNLKNAKTAVCVLLVLAQINVLVFWTIGLDHGKKSVCDGTLPVQKYNLKLARKYFPGYSFQPNNSTLEDDKYPNMCSKYPQWLVGKIAVNARTTLVDLLNDDVLRNVRIGGAFKPHDCVPRENLAVIIPYRDRRTHLDIFLMHIHTVLQRQMLQYKIYVVEMAHPTTFNRGVLANIGVLTARNSNNYTCYVIHDVDLLPANDRNVYTCSDVPRHLSSANSKFHYKVNYPEYFGGVTAFTDKQYTDINGFSNLFFGWGGEDDDLYNRVVEAGYRIERTPEHIGRYEALWHPEDQGNPINPLRHGLIRKSASIRSTDGLNNVKYTRLALELRPLYTWIYVRVNKTQILEGLLSSVYRPGIPAITFTLPFLGLAVHLTSHM